MLSTHHRDSIRLNPIDLNEESFAPYGHMLGRGLPQNPEVPSFTHPATDFWHEHDFETGPGGAPEILWVDYRNDRPLISSLEAHWLTQQAVVPLRGGPLLQAVACSLPDQRAPDLSTLKIFLIRPGQGVCMRAGCWHTSLVVQGTVTCLMLTRRSTTRDLVSHLNTGTPPLESSLWSLTEPVSFQRPAGATEAP